MSSRPSLPGPVRALLEASRALLGKASSAKVTIARLHGVADVDGMPRVVREEIGDGIERAFRSTTRDPMSGKDVEKALKEAWGKQRLDAFDHEPLAVRPHAQVHRGEIAGRAVAVKVARPGVASMMRNDLTLLTTLAAPIGAAFPGSDPGAMLREVRERTLDDLDLETEGATQRMAARRSRDLDGISVAAVDTELTTEGVMVSDYVDAPTLEQETPGDPAAVARALVRFYAGAPRALGGALCNPRASDVAVQPDGSVVMLHAGAFAKVDGERLDGAVKAVRALRCGDENAFATLLSGHLGVLPEKQARGAFALAHELMGDALTGPLRLDTTFLADLGERALDRLEDLYAIGVAGKPKPEDQWPGRAFAQAVALLARLEVSEDWVALALEALESGWE